MKVENARLNFFGGGEVMKKFLFERGMDM